MSVILQTRGLGTRSVDPAVVRRRGEAMLVALGLGHAEWSVVLCGDPWIQELNRDYRGKDRPTDVLAFPQGEPLGGGEVHALGDVVVSLPTARRQAAAHGVPIVTEVAHLMAHGLLHLLGLDHQTEDEDRRMRSRTDLILASAGIPRMGPGIAK